MRTVTYLGTLMRLAQEVGRARMSGDKERIEKAEREHTDYRDMCMYSDDLLIDKPEVP